MLWADSADNKLMIFFLFFIGNRIWHFMQIVWSYFQGKRRKIFPNVICWKFKPSMQCVELHPKPKTRYLGPIIMVFWFCCRWTLGFYMYPFSWSRFVRQTKLQRHRDSCWHQTEQLRNSSFATGVVSHILSEIIDFKPLDYRKIMLLRPTFASSGTPKWFLPYYSIFNINITNTCLCKYTENSTTMANRENFQIKILIFFVFLFKT